MSYAIKISGLSKSFSKHEVLKNIHINVPHQSVYGFLGNNGAGKSTLIRTILGLLKIDSGQIFINGHSISYQKTQYKKDIGSLVDSPCLYLQLTPNEFLSITTRLKNLQKSEIQKALEVVNMQEHASTPMNQFSLGMKQRIALASALIGSPKLLILDEPTNGLDPIGMQEIRELLKDLPNRIGATVFLSSHLLDEIQKTATHVGILNKGEMKLESSLADLLKNESSSMMITSENSKAIQTYFATKGIHSKNMAENQVCLFNINKNQCADINKQVIQAGFNLDESRFIQPTLENLFFKLVKSESNDNHTQRKTNAA
jgi:ABC-2 type transport system ATP-binding protein